MASWGKSVKASSEASDATSLLLAIEFTEWIRLRLVIVQKDNGAFEAGNSVTEDKVLLLGGSLSELTGTAAVVSLEVVYKQEFKSGEYVTSEVGLKSVPVGSDIAVLPSVAYRNMEVEAVEVGGSWVRHKPPGGNGSTVGGDSNSSGGGGGLPSGK
jgi:hypothetical protein